MQKFLTTSLLTLVFGYCVGQKYTGHYTPGNGVTERTLVDNAGVKFVLDSVQIMITAYGVDGKFLWATDAWFDNNLEKYRTNRPTIVSFTLEKNKRTKKEEVIWIVFNNSQFGTLEKQTGKFTFSGQD